MNWSTLIHIVVAVALMVVLAFLGPIWGAALGASLFFYAREMRDHQRERQTAGRGHRNRFDAWDLLPGVNPLKLDTLLDWIMPALACTIAAFVAMLL